MSHSKNNYKIKMQLCISINAFSNENDDGDEMMRMMRLRDTYEQKFVVTTNSGGNERYFIIKMII